MIQQGTLSWRDMFKTLWMLLFRYVEDISDMENKIMMKLNEIKNQKIGERKYLNKIKNIKQVSKKIEVANKALTKLTSDKNMNRNK